VVDHRRSLRHELPMSMKWRLQTASVEQLVLARTGHAQRGEPLQLSRSAHRVEGDEQVRLTELFLKPFRSLALQCFTHHHSLQNHEVYQSCAALFAQRIDLLTCTSQLASRLHSKSTHPNIKPGDLCVAHLREIQVDEQWVQGLLILKSETLTPFLTITDQNGDLQLSTVDGIYPEKIDKGCLIMDTRSELGYRVLSFDRGGEAKFWVRDFLGLEPVADADFLTGAYAKAAVSFVQGQSGVSAGDADEAPWERADAAREALDYFASREQFDLGDFEKEVLRSPERIEAFSQHLRDHEQEQGIKLAREFEISHKQAERAKRKVHAVLKLDTGVEIHVRPAKGGGEAPTLERGFDKHRGMKFVKVFYHRELGCSATQEDSTEA